MARGIANGIWTVALRLRDLLRKLGIGGGLERFLWRASLRLLPPPRGESVVPLAEGVSFHIPPRSRSARTFLSGQYEVATTKWFRKSLGEGMTFVDVGANIGYYSLLGSHLVGEQGHVYSFEPLPKNYEALTRNLQLNECRNVTPNALAVGRSSGREQFVDAGESSHIGAGRGSLEVTVTSLDDYFEAHSWPPIDLLKLDIEGGELEALAGMPELSRRSPSLRLIMEYAPEALEATQVSWRQLADRLTSLGFTHCRILDEKGTEVALDAEFDRSTLDNLLFSKTP